MSNVSGGLANVWLVISGLSFFCSLCLNIALLYVVVTKVLPIIADLTKKLNDLTGKVQEVTGQVHLVTDKVHVITDKVHVITEKVEGITSTAKTTVDVIHAKTTSILGTAESASAEIAKKIASASGILTTLFVAVRTISAMKEMKNSHDDKVIYENKLA